MYCPRCGQQFMTDVHFCSRCGLALNAIAEITATGGVVASSESRPAFTNRPPRQKGMRGGAMLMLGSLAVSPLFFAFCFAVEAGEPLLLPLAGFLIGLVWLLYSYIFADDRTSLGKRSQSSCRLGNASKRSLLAQPTEKDLNPFNLYQRKMRERIEPSSVTDHTTQFFD